jgi:hypothetical protein
METLKGYDNKEIYKYSDEELEEIMKSGNEKLIIKTYLNLNKSWYYQNDKENGKRSLEKARQYKHIVQKLFESKGWEAHIENPNTKEKTSCYIHNGIGYYIAVHQVPFSNEWNIELNDKELFKGNKLRTKEETLKLLKKRIGEEPIDLEKMHQNNEIDELDYKIIKAIMQEEQLIELHEINGTTIRCGAEEYKYYYDYNDAEEEARKYLKDGELWEMAVSEKRTTLGLDDWIEDVINMDGTFSIVSGYDGLERMVYVDGKEYFYCRVS